MPFYSFEVMGKLPADKYISEDQAKKIDLWFRVFFEKLGLSEITNNHCEIVGNESESIDADPT